MEGYSYINIFDTKGIEYLVIIAFLLLLIPFSIFIEKKISFKSEVRRVVNLLSHSAIAIPQGLFFSKHHTWAYLEKSGKAKVGLDQMMLGIAGEMKVNPLRYSSEMIRKGDVLAEIGMNGKRLRVFSPISGEIIKINPLLAENALADSDGTTNHVWLYEIRPVNWKDDTNSYFLAEEATAWFKSELERLKDFLAKRSIHESHQPSMVILQDGGELNEIVMDDFPERVWKDFQTEFLDPEESIDQSI
jgi:glycine cleavage system H protein